MKKYAVLIGNSEFPDEPDKKKLPALACPEQDVNDLASVLADVNRGEFDVLPLKNQESHLVLRKLQQTIKQLQADDLLLVYYSGHGKPNKNNILHLTTIDTVINELESTAIPIHRVYEIIATGKAKKIIIILDCCYSGAAGQGFRGDINDGLQQLNNSRGTYLVTASTELQVAHENTTDGYGLFTKHLIAGLTTGAADKDGDGFISMNELYDYVHDSVIAENPNQQPTRHVKDGRGDLIIAKSGRDSRTERASKIRHLLFDLAKQNDDIDELIFDALAVAKTAHLELSDSQLQQDQLLTQLLSQKLSPVSFAMRWVKISATPAYHHEPKVTNNKPPKQQADNQDQYGRYLDITVNNVKQRFRWIEAETFLMGSPESEPERYDNEKQHPVTLNQGYWLADTACTQALWQAVMGNNPSRFKGDNLPVEQVSYLDVQEFISRLNEKTGKNYALPTEAQWEYACRAKTTTPFYTGECINTEQANYDGDYDYDNRGAKTGVYKQTTVAVGSYPANPWGLYDMAGNVWEWTDSIYDANYGFAEFHCSSNNNPSSPRVLRGGSLCNGPFYLRSATRSGYTQSTLFNYIGFRLSKM